ncbi:MAG TPA: carbamoyltransferase HypF [Gammaproteobacteria bacterium]
MLSCRTMDQGDPGSTFTTRSLRIGGRVQGVGFRPFVSRMAHTLGIHGSVCNKGGEVAIIAQGDEVQLAQFLQQLLSAPPPAEPWLLADEPCIAPRHERFVILASHSAEDTSVQLPFDEALCAECQRELNDPADRRYHYPFINCSRCGPRYTLIDRLPYDRANTAMGEFALCPACQREYHDLTDRRYHAEPIGCPECGPSLRFVQDTLAIAGNGPTLAAAVTALRSGAIVAVKGIGGYHLLCDARNQAAVVRLRQRKQRPTKPLAVMFPWRGTTGNEAVITEVELTQGEATRLHHSQRPIVLGRRRADSTLALAVAPGLHEIGVLLPYSPLHHLLLDQFDGPLIATSGNLHGEPVLTADDEAAQRLGNIADAFLHHNRAIRRPADDSLYRTLAGETRPLRLGRGSTPLDLQLYQPLPHAVLAVGGHQKNTMALAWQQRAIISPHLGELDTPRAMQLFTARIDELQRLYQVTASAVVCDAHPGYASTRWARDSALPVTPVLHHHAHASALYGEHLGSGDWLVFTWDGNGYGSDGSWWGGETFCGAPGRWQRVASLRPFRLPGGEKAVRQPWRSALALCWEAGVEWPHAGIESTLLRQAWQRGLNAPWCSAVGRLFDGMAALLGVCQQAHYEGEAAILLEAQAAGASSHDALPLLTAGAGPWLIDWQPLLPLMLNGAMSTAERAGAFHHILAKSIVAVAHRARAQHAITTVGLTGGVFQNRLLCQLAYEGLVANGFEVRLATRLPGNDGGLAFGQVVEYLALLQRSSA